MKKRNIIYLISILILVIFDQVTKLLVVNNLSSGSDINIINNFLKFSYVENTGAAFGILNNNIIFLIGVSLLLIFYIIREIKNNENKLYVFSMSIILSGALGNLIDRIFRGYVVDFISFTIFDVEMPLFNIADMLITFGVIILLFLIIRGEENDKKSN